MKVTKTEAKCSQLPVDTSRKEGSLQKNSAEHGRICRSAQF